MARRKCGENKVAQDAKWVNTHTCHTYADTHTQRHTHVTTPTHKVRLCVSRSNINVSFFIDDYSQQEGSGVCVGVYL